MGTLLIISVVVLGFASFLKRKLCALPRHDDHVSKGRATAYPAPDSLPETALTMEFLRWNAFPAKTSANFTAIHR